MGIALAVKGLSFSYPKAVVKALDHVSFDVPAGEFLGLVGPNGAGKTTLMSLIASLLLPTEGKLSYFDNEASMQDPRMMVATAPQEIALYLSLTAWENLKLFGRLGRISTEKLKSRIEECLEFVGLTEYRNTLVHQFSGGMKRRLNLAAALITQPQILQLDEPTVGVDPQSRHLILSALQELNRNGTTILYSSHYLEEVEKICRQLILLDRGKVVFNGTSSEFKKTHTNSGSFEDRFMELTGKALRDL